jgi:serine/threonine-protein kinase
MSTAAAETINATAVNLIENLRGDVNQIFQLAATRPVEDFVRVFDLDAAEGFVGRQAVFDQLDAFVRRNRAGYFEILGAAGLGKTALASEIARRHDAVVFLASVGNTHRPDQFLEHVSAALIVRHKLGYTALPVRAGDDATLLGQILRESVEHAGGPVWLVVDALDEADPLPPGANPLLLPNRLPGGVYVVVTRRTGQLVTSPSTAVQRYMLRWNDPLQTADLAAFIRARVDGDRRLAEALASADPPMSPEAFVARLVEAGEGNFMYASYVLADVAERDPEAPPLDWASYRRTCRAGTSSSGSG